MTLRRPILSQKWTPQGDYNCNSQTLYLTRTGLDLQNAREGGWGGGAPDDKMDRLSVAGLQRNVDLGPDFEG
jgi:hypothetical protein